MQVKVYLQTGSSSAAVYKDGKLVTTSKDSSLVHMLEAFGIEYKIQYLPHYYHTAVALPKEEDDLKKDVERSKLGVAADLRWKIAQFEEIAKKLESSAALDAAAEKRLLEADVVAALAD